MNSEIIITSFPKCGRTWFTMILGRLLQTFYKFSENYVISTENLSKEIPNIPKIKIEHKESPHLKYPLELLKKLEKNKNKYKNRKIILLVRDIRDVFVSYYFHMTKRKKGDKRYIGEISKFIRKKKGGADSFIEYYNFWAKNKYLSNGLLIIKYEDLIKNTYKEVMKTLKFMGITIPKRNICEAIKYCSLKNMRIMEKTNKFNRKRLSPGDINDLESYKTRKGVVGGYIDYLSKLDIIYLSEKLKKLDQIYKYR